MIKNELQYKVTHKLLADFVATYAQLKAGPLLNTPKWLYGEQVKTVKSEIKRLKLQIKEYEELKHGEKKLPDLEFVRSLPNLLIQYRIASKMSQQDLAKKLGLHEQQIQKYESTNYEGASLATICKIAQTLESSLNSKAG